MNLKSRYQANMARLDAIRANVVHGRNGDHRAMADALDAFISFHIHLLTPAVPEAPLLPDGRPAYVVEGEWEATGEVDPVHGSLLHPYDVETAVALTLSDGRRLAFPDEAAARDFAYQHPDLSLTPGAA